MPVIRVKKWRLEELTGASLGELEEALFRLKCELEVREDYAHIEVNSDRPDMFIGEGVARAVGGLLGKRRGWRLPALSESRVEVVRESVPTRPVIAAVVVKNVNVDSEDFLEELIQFQEKLHDGLGRRRRKAAIGLHDLEKLPSTTIRYAMIDVDTRFKPLGSSSYTTVREVLNETEKGAAYGWIAASGGKHPALLAGDEVIAIPPVLNSEVTRVEVGTRHLFVDVTGVDEEVVSSVLDIIASTLAERRGAVVERVRVASTSSRIVYPELRSRRVRVEAGFFEKTLGVKMGAGEVVEHLERMLHNVETVGDTLEVSIAPFRVDVMGPVDLAEDVAISMGYDRIAEGRRELRPYTEGFLLGETRLARRLRELLIGLGFTEVMRLSLTSPQTLSALGELDRALRVSNPVQLEYSVLRTTMAASILEVLREAQHSEKPVRVFEIGPVIVKTGAGAVEDTVLGVGILDYSVGYEDIQAVVYTVLELLGLKPVFEPGSRSPYLIEGRRALACAERGPVTRCVGQLGEVSPQVLEAMGIEYPVALAEISVKKVLSLLEEGKS